MNPVFKNLHLREQQNHVAFQLFPFSISVNCPLQSKPKSKPPILKHKSKEDNFKAGLQFIPHPTITQDNSIKIAVILLEATTEL